MAGVVDRCHAVQWKSLGKACARAPASGLSLVCEMNGVALVILDFEYRKPRSRVSHGIKRRLEHLLYIRLYI